VAKVTGSPAPGAGLVSTNSVSHPACRLRAGKRLKNFRVHSPLLRGEACSFPLGGVGTRICPPTRVGAGVGAAAGAYPLQGLDLPTRPNRSCSCRADVPQILLAIPPAVSVRATTNLCFGTRRPPLRGEGCPYGLGGIGSKIWLSSSGRWRYSLHFKARPTLRSWPPMPTLAMYANGWGCGECGRACYVFVPRRKRPSGRNPSEVPVSTHIGYTPCCSKCFLFV